MQSIIEQIKAEKITICGTTYWRIWWSEETTVKAHEVNVGTTWHATYPESVRYHQTLSWYDVAVYPKLEHAVDAWVLSR